MPRPMINAVMLVGNLGKPAKVMYTKAQKKYCLFSIAITRDWQKKGAGNKPETDWVDCVSFSPTAADMLSDLRAKGRSVLISGAIQTWTGQDQNGNKAKRFQVLARSVTIIPPLDDIAHAEYDPAEEARNGSEEEGGSEGDTPF